jgi:hypothetical protein
MFMPEMHVSEEDLILHYYGETPADSSAARHIANCAHCTIALQELSEVLRLVETEKLPEPLAGLEQRVWSRVQPEIARKRESWFSRLFESTPRWVFAGGVAVLVIAAFVAGRFTGPQTSPVIPATPNIEMAVVVPPATTDKLMNVAVGEHLDQSQMVLMELLNADVQASNIQNEQERARDLVAANRLFRQIAVRSGDEGVREVLDALERVLIEIANAPPDVSASELAALRSDIEQRGILFRVRVVASEMRAREEKDVMAAPVATP